MKKLLPFILILAVVLMAACNSKPQADANNGKMMTYVDTSGLAAFQQWKAQNELKDPSVYYMQGREDAAREFSYAKQSTPVRKKTVTKPKAVSNSGGSMNTVSEYPAKKKGWSKKAKGAAIGGGGGAILGAVINKKDRVKGGIIGGLLGAGLGYVLGNEMDKKK